MEADRGCQIRDNHELWEWGQLQMGQQRGTRLGKGQTLGPENKEGLSMRQGFQEKPCKGPEVGMEHVVGKGLAGYIGEWGWEGQEERRRASQHLAMKRPLGCVQRGSQSRPEASLLGEAPSGVALGWHLRT
jgi:hypothetical protein